MGPARIPPSEIATWLDLEGFDDPTIRADLFQCIQRLGDEILREDDEPKREENAEE